MYLSSTKSYNKYSTLDFFYIFIHAYHFQIFYKYIKIRDLLIDFINVFF